MQQLGKENKDWQMSGQITNNFIQYMNEGYEILELGNIKKPSFYFVNVPQRYNTAWVLPVGIDDAVWFEYRGSNFTTHNVSSLEEARSLSDKNKNARIFVFDKDGDILIRD